jgi:hypothetical protein
MYLLALAGKNGGKLATHEQGVSRIAGELRRHFEILDT